MSETRDSTHKCMEIPLSLKKMGSFCSSSFIEHSKLKILSKVSIPYLYLHTNS